MGPVREARGLSPKIQWAGDLRSVITIESLGEIPERVRGAFVAVGNFDGVHRGHSRLIARLRANAEAARTMAPALSFDPPPVRLLRPDEAPVPLVWTGRKAALLQEAG